MPPTPADPQAAVEADRAKEWQSYRAAEVIYINGGRAFNPGDPVPASHVTRGLVTKSQVTKVEG